MSPRRNYGFDRRQREATRKSRQEAKQQRKAERASDGSAGPEMGEAPETTAPVGQWEWFSASRGRVVATAPKQRPAVDGPDDWVLLTEVGDEASPEGSA
jgi:hypothetical protein